jgi:hypothetical protein
MYSTPACLFSLRLDGEPLLETTSGPAARSFRPAHQRMLALVLLVAMVGILFVHELFDTLSLTLTYVCVSLAFVVMICGWIKKDRDSDEPLTMGALMLMFAATLFAILIPCMSLLITIRIRGYHVEIANIGDIIDLMSIWGQHILAIDFAVSTSFMIYFGEVLPRLAQRWADYRRIVLIVVATAIAIPPVVSPDPPRDDAPATDAPLPPEDDTDDEGGGGPKSPPPGGTGGPPSGTTTTGEPPPEPPTGTTGKPPPEPPTGTTGKPPSDPPTGPTGEPPPENSTTTTGPAPEKPPSDTGAGSGGDSQGGVAGGGQGSRTDTKIDHVPEVDTAFEEPPS